MKKVYRYSMFCPKCERHYGKVVEYGKSNLMKPCPFCGYFLPEYLEYSTF